MTRALTIGRIRRIGLIWVAVLAQGCSGVRAYRIWTAPEPIDGYAIGHGMVIGQATE